MSIRAGATIVFVCAVLGLSACAKDVHTDGVGSLAPVTPSATATPTAPPTTAPPTTAKPVATVTITKTAAAPVAALTCGELKTALVGSTTVSYNGYHDSIPLGGGVWSGEDGTTVTLDTPCGIGDLNGDGAKDAVGVVVATTGGTGEFYTLVVWRNSGGHPVFAALKDIDDRNPVQTISIANGKATVVYLTRTDDAPMAEVNIKRTAVFKLSGHTFTELSHTDQPFTGS
jgi:hypothetical protein